MIKVLLADDQELIRQSLSFVMSRQEDIEMVGTAANGCEALELVEEKQPDGARCGQGRAAPGAGPAGARGSCAAAQGCC